jgi:cobalt-zinc-cadmium efflux system outer membrane protein
MKAMVVLVASLVAGCASYESSPLPTASSLAHDAAHLSVDVKSMPTEAMREHRFDPADGFDITEIAMLAVADNPALRAARADAGVTRAQAFSAGLLPDPQVALGRDQALGSPAGATVAWNFGLTVDVGALLTRSSTHAAADAESRKSELNLLWTEWQTVAKARLLFVKMDAMNTSLDLLQESSTSLQSRYDRTRTAVERGLITSDAATPQFTALQDVERQRNDLERQRNQTRHDLNELLGVDPAVELVLVASPNFPTIDEGQVQQALAAAPLHRPDLLALQAGYDAQDDRYRGALRAQFPAITIGPTRARDTSDVNTVGFALSIALPIFNRNRGNIAIEKATRSRLREDYQQRIDSTTVDAHRILAEQSLLLVQRAAIATAVGELSRATSRAQAAFQARNVDALTLTNAESALLAKRLESIAVEQALREQAISLQALVGGDLTEPHQPSSP